MEPVESGVNKEIDDARFGGIIVKGTLIGVPLAFVLSLLVALPGAGWPLAAGVAVWPALVGGPFIGGFVALMSAMAALEPGASVTPLTARAPTPLPSSRAA
jgi:hypothetical protein